MKLTCSQMDVLISFYLEGDLSDSLKMQVEKHIEECPVCSAKYELVKSMLAEMRSSLSAEAGDECCDNDEVFTNTEKYGMFHTNLSAYMDNELSDEENLRVKKFAISNKAAREELQHSYDIRRLMSNSFAKARGDARADFTKSTLKQVQPYEESVLNFHPAIKLLIVFTVSVLVFTTIVVFSLSV